METPTQAKEVLQSMRNLFQRHIACDLILTTTPCEKEFKVHKALLGTFSGYFRNLLKEGKLSSNLFNLECDPDTLEKLLMFIYNGEVAMDIDVQQLHDMACTLQVPLLMEICQTLCIKSEKENAPGTSEAKEKMPVAAPADHTGECDSDDELGLPTTTADMENIHFSQTVDKDLYPSRSRQTWHEHRRYDTVDEGDDMDWEPGAKHERKMSSGRGRGKGRGRGRGKGRGRGRGRPRGSGRAGRCMTNEVVEGNIDSRLPVENPNINDVIKKEPNDEVAAVLPLKRKRGRPRLDAQAKRRLPSGGLPLPEEATEIPVKRVKKHGRKKMYLSDYRCPTCCKIFVHYSANKLHQKLHSRVRDHALKARDSTKPVHVYCRLTTAASARTSVEIPVVPPSKGSPDAQTRSGTDMGAATSAGSSEDIVDMKSRVAGTPTSDCATLLANLDYRVDDDVTSGTSTDFNVALLWSGQSVSANTYRTILPETLTTDTDRKSLVRSGDSLEVGSPKEESISICRNAEGITARSPRRRLHLAGDVYKRLCRVKSRVFSCRICRRRFPLLSAFHRHFGLHHGRSWRCGAPCGLRCASWASYRLHKRRVHPARDQVKSSGVKHCSRCGIQFLFHRTLTRHMSAHIDGHGRDVAEVERQSPSREFTSLFQSRDEGQAMGDEEHNRDVISQSVKLSPPREAIRVNLMCRHCDKVYKYRKALSIHLLEHGLTTGEIALEFTDPGRVPLRRAPAKKSATGRQTYACPVCSRAFGTDHHLRGHMSRVHELPVTKACMMRLLNVSQESRKVKEWRCMENDCQYTGITRLALKKHMLQTHTVKISQCDECPFSTPIEAELERHVQLQHKRGKTCEFCNKQFKKYYFLKVHRFTNHNIQDPSLKLHHCQEEGCDYVTFQHHLLEVHMHRHNTEKPFSCSECNKKLKTQKNLDKHINKVHMRIRPYICDQCGASYGEESELKTHMMSHETEKRFKCEQCEYETQDKGNFQSHLWARHKRRLHQKQKVFSCSRCDYSTDRKTRFTQHMDFHNDVRPFQCPECPKRFTIRTTLNSHVQWVHSEKSLRCDYCDYLTNTLQMLREHVRMMHTHRDVKPYKCAYCDYHSRTSGNCRKHCVNRHKDREVKWIKVCEKYPNNSRPFLTADMEARKPGAPSRIFPYAVDKDAVATSGLVAAHDGAAGYGDAGDGANLGKLPYHGYVTSVDHVNSDVMTTLTSSHGVTSGAGVDFNTTDFAPVLTPDLNSAMTNSVARVTAASAAQTLTTGLPPYMASSGLMPTLTSNIVTPTVNPNLTSSYIPIMTSDLPQGQNSHLPLTLSSNLLATFTTSRTQTEMAAPMMVNCEVGMPVGNSTVPGSTVHMATHGDHPSQHHLVVTQQLGQGQGHDQYAIMENGYVMSYT